MIFLIGLSPDFLDPDEDTEPPTRKLEDDVDGHADAASTSHQANNPSLGDQSSIISRDDSHSAIVGNDDIALLKLRNGQLKKLRKEMRKLEKLDKIRLKRVEEGQKRETLTEIELLKQIMVLSDDSSISTATGRSSISALAGVAKHSSSRSPSLVAPPSNYRGIEGQSASGSDNKKSSSNKATIGAILPEPSPLPPPTLAPDQTKIKQQQGKRKPSVSSVKEFCKPGGSSTSKKDGKTNTYGSCRPSASAAVAAHSEAVVEGIASASIPAPSMLSSSNCKTNVTDFGQTFPTPREMTAVTCSTSTMSVEEAAAAASPSAANSVEKRFPSEKKAHRSNNLVPSNASTNAASVKSRKPHRSPLSYYLPLPKKHSLIKDARLRSHSQENNKENKAPNRLSEPEPEQVEKEPLSLQVRIQDLIGWSLFKKSVDFAKIS